MSNYISLQYIPNDIKNIIYEYKHNLHTIDIFEELKKTFLKKELLFEYSKNDVLKILNKMNTFNYKIYIDYEFLEKNIYSKVLILSIDNLENARKLEDFFIENNLNFLGVGNYNENENSDKIKGFFVYDHTIINNM